MQKMKDLNGKVYRELPHYLLNLSLHILQKADLWYSTGIFFIMTYETT